MKAPSSTVPMRSLVRPTETWNPSRADGEEIFNYVDLSSVDADLKAISGVRTLACSEAPSRARQLVKAKDVLVSTVRPNLNGVASVPEELEGATASTGFCVLRCNASKLNDRYLFHWVTSPAFVSGMVKLATGASYPAVSDRIILNSEIPIPHKNGNPDLDEQKRIAAILDKADAIRRNRQQALRLTDDFLRSVFLDMFGSDSKPKCNRVPLGPFLEFMTSGGRGWSQYYAPSGARFIRSLDVQMNSIGDKDIVFVDAPNNAEATRTRVKENDVLLTITGSLIGRVARVPKQLACSYISQHVAILRLTSELEPEFLTRFLSMAEGQRLVQKSQYGQTKPGLNFDQIRRFSIPLPTTDAQQRFTTIAAALNKRFMKCHELATQSNDLFSSLQQRAFRGEL